MKIKQLELDETGNYLKITDLENWFETFEDKRNNTVFDINRTVYINVDPSKLPDFVCDSEMHWPLISYKIYGTTRLAWLLWKLNGVTAKDVFKAKQPKDEVKYLPKQYSDTIIADINEFES